MRPSNPQTLAALMTRAMQAFPQGLSSPCAETSWPDKQPSGKRGTGSRGPEPCRQSELGLTKNISKIQGLPTILVTLGRNQIYAAIDCFASDCFINAKLIPENQLTEKTPSTAKLAGEQTTMPLIGKPTFTIHQWQSNSNHCLGSFIR